MVLLSAEVAGLIRVRDTYRRFRDNLPIMLDRLLWKAIKRYELRIKEQAARAFTFPRPYLIKTIRAKKRGRNAYVIEGARYAWFVEFGRRPGKAPPPSRQLERWADLYITGPPYGEFPRRKKAIILGKGIARKGTRPRPFIRPGIRRAHAEIIKMLRAESASFIKREGRL